MDAGDVFGRGIGFPPRVRDGRLAWSDGEANVRESVQIVLKTDRNERIRRPDFGAGLRRTLLEPNVATTHRQIQDRIENALAAWEPRLAVESVDVERDPDDAETAVATILYRLVATQGRERLTLSVALGA